MLFIFIYPCLCLYDVMLVGSSIASLFLYLCLFYVCVCASLGLFVCVGVCSLILCIYPSGVLCVYVWCMLVVLFL